MVVEIFLRQISTIIIYMLIFFIQKETLLN